MGRRRGLLEAKKRSVAGHATAQAGAAYLRPAFGGRGVVVWCRWDGGTEMGIGRGGREGAGVSKFRDMRGISPVTGRQSPVGGHAQLSTLAWCSELSASSNVNLQSAVRLDPRVRLPPSRERRASSRKQRSRLPIGPTAGRACLRRRSHTLPHIQAGGQRALFATAR